MKTSYKKRFDVAVIGGGFYGCIIALFLKKKFKNVVILEKESDLMLRASYNNQARIHNGYHYPRSFITALRSHINYPLFISDFKEVVVDNFLMTYAIATNSKITSQQFLKFCRQIGSPINPAPKKIRNFFDNRLIEDVFVVEEVVFSATKLRELLRKKLSKAKVKILYQNEVLKTTSVGQTISLDLASGDKITSSIVINCAYANINRILKNSFLPLLPLKYELTEMPLIKLPTELTKMGITIMDGPFFSIMPFPDRKLHTIHHVRYTPYTTFKKEAAENNFSTKSSNFIYIIKDAKRYISLLDKVQYKGSLYETKTILAQTELTDARPILFKKDYGIKNLHIILGGKMDNVYDIIDEFRELYNI